MAHSPRLLAIAAVASAAVLTFASAAAAAPGDLDPSFGGGDGIATTAVGTVDNAFAMTIDDSGRIVLAGSAFSNATKKDFAVVRYAPDGSLDAGFGGGDGILTTNFGTGTQDEALDVGIDSLGRIVLAGSSTNGTQTDFALARYDSSGIPDPTFDTDGRLTSDFAGGPDVASSLLIGPGDGIVVAGSSTNGTQTDFALARYDSSGIPDPTFDADGRLTTDFAGDNDGATAVAFDGAGYYVAGGFAYNGASKDDFALARYDSSGTLDPTFDTDGKVVTPGTDRGRDLAIDADGRIVVAGSDYAGTSLDFALIRYRTNGSIDTSFGSHGQVTTAIGAGADGAEALAIDAAGTIAAAGYTANGTDRDFALTRYAPNGAILGIFGMAGKVVTTLGPSDSARDVAFDSNGDVVLAGYATTGSNADFAALRYIGVGDRADAMIKRPSDLTYTGDNVYNTSGAGQTRTAKAKAGNGATFTLRVQNEGTAADAFTFLGCGDSAGFAMSYKQGATDITAEVETGTYSTGALPPAGDASIQATVSVDASAVAGTIKSCKISATSAGDPTATDVAKAKVKVVN